MPGYTLFVSPTRGSGLTGAGGVSGPVLGDMSAGTGSDRVGAGTGSGGEDTGAAGGGEQASRAAINSLHAPVRAAKLEPHAGRLVIPKHRIAGLSLALAWPREPALHGGFDSRAARWSVRVRPTSTDWSQ